MKMRAPTDEEVHLALTTGHTFVVPPATADNPEGVEVPKRFVRKALMDGCIAAGEVQDSGPSEAEEAAARAASRTSAITKALQAMLDGSETDDFKTNGMPNEKAVMRRVGFKVSVAEVNAIFTKLKESGAGAGGDDES